MPRGEELESARGKVTKVPCRLVCGEILVPQSRHRAPNCAPLRSPDIAGGLGRGILVTLIAVCVNHDIADRRKSASPLPEKRRGISKTPGGPPRQLIVRGDGELGRGGTKVGKREYS